MVDVCIDSDEPLNSAVVGRLNVSYVSVTAYFIDYLPFFISYCFFSDSTMFYSCLDSSRFLSDEGKVPIKQLI